MMLLGEALDVSAAWLLGIEHTLGLSEWKIHLLMRYRLPHAAAKHMALHVLHRRRSAAA
jgi:hypothetical protein